MRLLSTNKLSLMLVLLFMLTAPIIGSAQKWTYEQGQQFMKVISEGELALEGKQFIRMKNMKENPLYKQVIPVQIGNLASIQTEGDFLFMIPGKEDIYEAVAKTIEARSEDDFFWYGDLLNADGTLTVMAKDGDFYGQINIGDEIYQIKDLGGRKNVLVQVDETAYAGTECGNSLEELDLPDKEEILRSHPRNGNSLVRVLVMFTDAADAIVNPTNEANLLIGQSNTALRNSGINAGVLNFQLAGVRRLAGFNEVANDIVGDRDRFRTNAAVATARDANEADLVVLLTDGNYRFGTATVFGIAFLNQTNNDAFAHAIVEADAAGGRFTFTHELAHLFDARHDDDPAPGFAHAHNFNTRSCRRCWLFFNCCDDVRRRTILNGLPAGQSRIQHFSNPNVNFDGVASGVNNTRDNARQLSNLACTIADYRPFTPPMSVRITGPGGANNGQSVTFCTNVTNCNNVTNYTWAVSTDGFLYNIVFGANSSCVTRNMPFDSDLYVRVTATCSDGRTADAFFYVYNFDGCGTPFILCRGQEISEDRPMDLKASLRTGNAGPSSNLINTFPNPARDFVNVYFELAQDDEVSLRWLDINGKEVRATRASQMAAGKYEFQENISDFGSGMHLLELRLGDEVFTRKVLIQKQP